MLPAYRNSLGGTIMEMTEGVTRQRESTSSPASVDKDINITAARLEESQLGSTRAFGAGRRQMRTARRAAA